MKLRRIVSCMMALLLVCSLPVSAFAAEYDLALGSVIVNATESGQTVTHGSNAAVPDSAPVITQSNSSTPTSNTVTITAAADTTANVTLSGVNIETSGAAVEIKGNGDVVIELDGSNTVQSGDGHAGVEKNTIAPTDNDPGSGNGNLTITDENGTQGSLQSTGGVDGAGIGGGFEGDTSNITITGNAEVTATSGAIGAGIGGGFLGSGSNITITGSAEVTATGGVDGAGIGGGGGGSGNNIEISGSAEVTAQGGAHGAGIGGGDDTYGDGGGSGSNITITGSAEVTATGGVNGAGIGGGGGGGGSGSGSNITISGGKVEATGYDAAGIGGGFLSSGSSITISGGKVEATGYGGAGIGGGEFRSGSSITITGGKVEATGYGGAGIGGGRGGSGSDITISGSAEVNAQGRYDGGAGIGGGSGGSGSDITISGSAEVTAKGGASGAGIGGGVLKTGSDITISEDAQVKVQGGEQSKDSSSYFGVGAAIGDGGKRGNSTDAIAGEEKNPNTDELTPNGKIEYYAPGVNMETGAPTKTVTGTYGLSQPTEPVQPAQPEEEAPQIAAPYRVVGQDGKNLAFKKAQSSGVLTITVDADFATLTGSASGLKTLKEQGLDTIVFVTNGATSTFALADLLAQVPSGSTYALTHVGSTVTLTLSSGEDISSILK